MCWTTVCSSALPHKCASGGAAPKVKVIGMLIMGSQQGLTVADGVKDGCATGEGTT